VSRKSKHTFTAADDIKINDLRFQHKGWGEIGELFDPPINKEAVRSRARVMDMPCLALKFRAPPRFLKKGTHEWPDELDKILSDNWGKVSANLIAAMVHKTTVAVEKRAVRMGLHVPVSANKPPKPKREITYGQPAPTRHEVLPPMHEITWGAIMATMDPAWIAARLSE